jgi:hypothetical protein
MDLMRKNPDFGKFLARNGILLAVLNASMNLTQRRNEIQNLAAASSLFSPA